MASKYSTSKGIIIRLIDSREADRIIYILDSQGNKITASVPGVKKANSRKAYAIDLLNLIEFKASESGQMSTITEAKLLTSPVQLKQDLAGLQFVQLIAEITGNFAQENNSEVGYYNNLVNLLQIADTSKLTLIAAAYILRCLYLSGSLPNLQFDEVNDVSIDSSKNIYLAEGGGYTNFQSEDKSEISVRLYKSQQFCLRYDFNKISKLELSKEEQLKLLGHNLDLAEKVLSRQVRSAKMFLETI